MLTHKTRGNTLKMVTAQTLRAARALLGWSRAELAKRSNTSAETIKNFEKDGSDPKTSTVQRWRTALVQAGVEFLDPDVYTPGTGPGVRIRVPPKGQAKARG